MGSRIPTTKVRTTANRKICYLAPNHIFLVRDTQRLPEIGAANILDGRKAIFSVCTLDIPRI
jgi:hypothetical protein